MSSALGIEATDSSGRWYMLPGSDNAFDLKVTNGSDHAVLCKLGLDEPSGAGAVMPSTVTLKAGEERTVSVSFNPDWLSLRDRKAVVTARNAAGTVLATFVHDLIAATTTDCSVSLAWKDEIVAEGALRGFTLACTVRSISSTPGVFEPEFTSHAALRFPDPQRITLGPGESSTFEVPIIWNRSARDAEGWNHPRTIEVGVPVTHGRRGASAPWDLVQQHVEPYLTEADRAPVLARRPPPPQFTAPGGIPPPVSPMPAVKTEPTLATAVTESPSARIARAEMEAGVATGGMRLPPQTTAPPPPPPAETISVAPGTLLLIALGFVAIVVILFAAVRGTYQSAVSTSPVLVASPAPAVALPASHPRLNAHLKPNSKTKQTSKSKNGAPPAQRPAATVDASTASAVATAAPTPAPAATTRAAAGSRPAPARRAAVIPPRMSPLDRNALVQLTDVGAGYLRGGRLVRVTWDSYAQVRADIQLLDDRSSILAETTVGRRESAVLVVPRGYNGPVYVQVTAYDFNGERVVSSTSLGPP